MVSPCGGIFIYAYNKGMSEVKRKLRILGIFANHGGCSYYRCLNPLKKLEEVCPDEVEVRLDDNPLELNKETMQWNPDAKYENMKWADVIMINNISNFGGPYTARCVGLAREFGKFVHTDTDDLLTELYDEHKLAGVYKEQQLSELTKHLYYNSDLVTVTQFKFADRVKPFCSKFLAVIKNAIDYDLPAWNQSKRPSKMVRVGWAGGIHHLPDVKHFASVPHIVNQKVGKENVKWNFYGHPPPNPDGSKDWQFDTWRHYMDNFFRGFKGHKNYEIFYALPPSDYGVYFSDMDIAIAPLEMNPFNDSKSDIKIAECGRYKIPFVGQDVGCYSDVIKNGYNGYLIPPDAPKSEWVKALTKLIKDKDLRLQMGENLYKQTEELFNLKKVVRRRLDIYNECFKTMGKDPRNES